MDEILAMQNVVKALEQDTHVMGGYIARNMKQETLDDIIGVAESFGVECKQLRLIRKIMGQVGEGV